MQPRIQAKIGYWPHNHLAGPQSDYIDLEVGSLM